MSSASGLSMFKRICVIGFGQMGQGIAQSAASAGYTVSVYDSNASHLKLGFSKIEKNLLALAEKLAPKDDGSSMSSPKVLVMTDVLARIQSCPTVDDAITDADLVIEAIKEDRSLKSDLFQELFKTRSLSPNAILATNTSSFQVSEFAAMSDRHANRIVGLHFFNPVDRMKLVEIIGTKFVKPQTVQLMHHFVTSLQKIPVVCKDTPGFIVNRLLLPYLLESVRMAEAGTASIQDIDIAMKYGAGYPMGPFALLDMVGLDTVKSAVDGWRLSEPNNDLLRPSYLLDKLVEENKLGRKTGSGFYDYSQAKM